MARVALCGVRKAFGQTVVVQDVNLEILDREFVVLVGPSGCGKSTTLRMIAGLEEVTAGEIYIGDRLVNDVAPKDRDIAMVFQNYALYPHMNVYQNMAFALRLRRFPKAEIDRRVHEVAGLLGIEDLLSRKPKALSGGQRQRVAVGRAIVREPQVFLMDEPLSNLDAKLRVQMRSELSKLHNRLQTTIIYVTHDQTEAMTMGDRIVVMKDGRIMQIGAPLEVYERPANLFVAGFIGSPAMNFLRGRLERAAGQLFFRGEGLRLPLDKMERYSEFVDRDVVLGLRPEDIHDAGLHPEVPAERRAEVAVEVVEMMGSEAYVNATVGTHTLVARVEPTTGARDGCRHTLGFNMNKAHLFDPVTELALG